MSVTAKHAPPQVVRFAPALGAWVQGHLTDGHAPGALVEAMQAQGMAGDAAQAIVAGFTQALREGRAPPFDVVDLPAPAAGAVARVVVRAEPLRMAVLDGVIDANECEELIALARPRLKPSTIVDPATGRDTVSGLRASYGMFFRPLENPLVERLDRRMAALMNLPVAHGEGLQVLHYPEGAGSAPHFDFLVPSNAANLASIARSGQRVSTLVTYLNDVPEGGETAFPAVGWTVAPRRGHAVYFQHCDASGEVDHASLHASQTVLRGEKWVATKWMRSRPFVSA
jgi:prolyl 4-hydroxylase